MDDWTALRTFLAAVELRSFSAAARRLGISQSTVSRHVAMLEEVVGQPLFVRAGRAVSPTDAGAALASPAGEVRDAVTRFERIAAGRERSAGGVVRVATLDEIVRRILVPALPKLRAEHPDVVLEVASRTETASLERRDADLAIRFTLPTNPDLVRKKVAGLEYRVFGTKRLLREPSSAWVGFERALDGIPEARWLAANVPADRVVFRATSIEAQAEAAAAGVGLALLPNGVAAEHPRLAARSRDVVLTRPLWIVAHRDVYAAPRIKAVFRWAAEACSAPGPRRR